MAVGAVARVDHAAFEMFGDEVLRTGGGVTHHHQIHLKRFDVAHGIEQCFTFAKAAHGSLHVDDVGAEPLFGEFKRDPGAGARFDEEVHDGHAAQRWHLLDLALRNLLELFGGVEDEGDLLGAQVIETEQVFSGPLHLPLAFVYACFQLTS